jgi:hypothetical protein
LKENNNEKRELGREKECYRKGEQTKGEKRTAEERGEQKVAGMSII